MEVPEEGEGRSGPGRKPSKAIAVVTPEKKSHRLVIAAHLSLAILKDERKKKQQLAPWQRELERCHPLFMVPISHVHLLSVSF